jgi:hypothetical protein
MRYSLLLLLFLSLGNAATAAPYQDRFVWVFGWNLERDSDVPEVTKVIDSASSRGLNGAVVSFGLDTLCRKSPDFFRRLDAVRQACDRGGLEVIPAIFSVGYGGAALAHNRNLAEGVAVEDAAFVARGDRAQFVPDDSVRLANGDFELYRGNSFRGFNFHDQPGVISFADTQVKHGGKSAIRLENFTANPHGHGRVMQELRVRPHRCYRLSLWVKTEGLAPSGVFQVLALVKDREIAPRTFSLPATTDWRKITMIFNSLNHEKVNLYAGVWGAKAGKLWIDDWTVEEVGPLNVLHRPGTPVLVRSEDGATTYAEGRDYAPLEDPQFSFYRVDRPWPQLRLLPGGSIRDGQKLRVSWYHPMQIHDSQITVCMGEPELYEIFEHEAKLLAEKLHPKRVLLNMDEIRRGGTCAACRGRNMGELLGECITRQVQILRRHMPGVQVYIWSDMLDPNHNAHGDYYLVDGDFTGSWDHVPRDLVMAVWGGEPREKNLQFFVDKGFATLCACYYDADSLDSVKGWLQMARPLKNVRGFMYTPWLKKYELLPGFGDLLKAEQ